jgi:hypothetical protein
MRSEYGRPLNLRAVYMMNCVGASLNSAWLGAGAKTSCGTVGNNYLPEPTNFFFWQNWKAGQTFEAAATGAYLRTVRLLNDTVRDFIGGLPIPGASAIASRIDLSGLDFVTSSSPTVAGQREVQISSDDLVFPQSIEGGLATVVLPIGMLLISRHYP